MKRKHRQQRARHVRIKRLNRRDKGRIYHGYGGRVEIDLRGASLIVVRIFGANPKYIFKPMPATGELMGTPETAYGPVVTGASSWKDLTFADWEAAYNADVAAASAALPEYIVRSMGIPQTVIDGT